MFLVPVFAASTAALLQYDECKSNPNELLRRVQRNSFVESHGLELHESVSEFCCELMPCEEGFANDEDSTSQQASGSDLLGKWSQP